MKELSIKSKEIVERFKIHRSRCLHLALILGEDSATAFHVKFKGDPGSSNATREFERLISAAGN